MTPRLEIAVLVCCALFLVSESSAQPKPTPTPTPKVDAPAAQLLEKMSRAYANLKSLEVEGVETMESTDLRNNVVATGRGRFRAAYLFPNQFRIHEGALKTSADDANPMRRTILAISDGKEIRSSDPEAPYKDVSKAKAPTQRISDDPNATPGPISFCADLLILPLFANPAARLTRNAESVTRIEDVVIGSDTCPAIAIKMPFGQLSTVVVLDPATSLIRRYTTTSVSAGIQKTLRTLAVDFSKPNREVDPAQFE
jgi:hypothetical protein